MKEQLEELGLKIIEQIEKAGVFALDQLPILVTEILTYYTIYHAFWIFICILIIFLIMFFMYNKWIKYEVKRDEINFAWLCTFLSISVPSMFLLVNLTALIKITVAPRLYLIQKISSLF
jgi:hypothetical protein